MANSVPTMFQRKKVEDKSIGVKDLPGYNTGNVAQTLEDESAGKGRSAGFGIDHDLALKQAEKYDSSAEAQAQAWIEEITQEPFTESFGPQLKDGTTLCKLANGIKPGTIKKINSSKLAFKQMENVTFFLKACRKFGVPESSLFETVDLYELKDLGLVLQCIFGLGETVRGKADFPGVPELVSANQAAAEAAGVIHVVKQTVPEEEIPVEESPTNTTTQEAADAAAPEVAKTSAPAETTTSVATPPPAEPATSVPSMFSRNKTESNVDVGLKNAPGYNTGNEAQQLEDTSAGVGRSAGFGIDHDLAVKQMEKYDKDGEAKAIKWIEELTGISFTESFGPQLKNGVMLCELLNAVKPGTIKKVVKSKLAFKQMENVSHFLTACKGLGVPSGALFETVDLFEQKDLGLVLQALFALSRTLEQAGLLEGKPVLVHDISTQ